MPKTSLPARSRQNRTRTRPFALRALLTLLLVLVTAVAAAQAETDPAATPAATTTTPVDADPVVIQVGELREHYSDIAWRFEIAVRNFAGGQGMAYSEELAAQMFPMLPTYLEQRGTELVLLREAARRGLEPDAETVETTLQRIKESVPEGEDYDATLAEAGFKTEQMLVTLIEEGDLITQVINAFNEEVAPSEDQLKVRYHADIALYTEPESYCARHILVPEEAVAGEIVERVAAGEDFATLAGEFGTDGTATRGGDLGCFPTGAMVAPFEEAVIAAEIGAVTGPVETQFGYHALLVYDHHEASVAEFAEVRDQVEESVAADTANARLGGLLSGAGVITYPERIPAPPAVEPASE